MGTIIRALLRDAPYKRDAGMFEVGVGKMGCIELDAECRTRRSYGESVSDRSGYAVSA